MNQNGALQRNEPYSFVAAATITSAGTFSYGPLANTKPVDAVIVQVGAANQTLVFQDQNKNSVTLTFPVTGVYVLPISPSSIQTSTAAQVLVAYC